jgi:energy-coupling factor transporter ATP-binding protein EcfA2
MEEKIRNPHDPIRQIVDDQLGRKELAGRILRRLADPNCPSVLGVYGGWGSGKSSLLQLICRLNEDAAGQHLADGRKLRIFEVDAWKYESSGNLFIPVVAKLTGGVPKDTQLADAARKVLRVTGGLIVNALVKMADQQAGGIVGELKSGLERQDELDLFAWVDEVEKTDEAFSALVRQVCDDANPPQRVILCIDNLDRCSPENVIHLLESIKNFTNVAGCYWVFFMDSDVVASYVNKKYQGTAVDGNSYLDKIVPEQYHLAAPSPRQDYERLEALMSAVVGDAARDQLLAVIDWLPNVQLPRLTVPRRLIKTALKFEQYIQNTSAISPRLAFALILLYHAWPDFYERLVSERAEHVEGVLQNFADMDTAKVEIPPHYIADKDLAHFLQRGLLSIEGSRDAMRPVMMALRTVGLP